MAQLVTVNDPKHPGDFVLVRRGEKNTRIRPTVGGEDFLVPTEKVLFTDTVVDDVPKTERAPEVKVPVKAAVPDVEPVVIPYLLPSSDAPFWVLNYTLTGIIKHEFSSIDTARDFIQPIFGGDPISKFGNATFKAGPSSLYELHNFTFADL